MHICECRFLAAVLLLTWVINSLSNSFRSSSPCFDLFLGCLQLVPPRFYKIHLPVLITALDMTLVMTPTPTTSSLNDAHANTLPLMTVHCYIVLGTVMAKLYTKFLPSVDHTYLNIYVWIHCLCYFQDVHSRLVYGSDYPVPAIATVTWTSKLQRWILLLLTCFFRLWVLK